MADPAERMPWRRLSALLVAVACFGFSWSGFLLVPKYMRLTLGAGPDEVGIAWSLATGMGTFVAPLSSVLLGRYPSRYVMACGAALLAVAASLYPALATSLPGLYALQVVQGIGAAFAFNGAAAATATLVPPSHLNRAIGYFGSANLVMNAVAPSVGEAWIARFGGWSSFFWLLAGAAVLSAILSLRLRAESPARDAAESGASGPEAGPGAIVALHLAMLGLAVPFSSTFSFGEGFAHSQGVTQIAPLFMGYVATALLVRIAFGGVGDRVGPHRVALVALTVYALVPLSLLGLGATQFFAVGLFQGLCHGFVYPSMLAQGVVLRPRAPGSIVSTLNGAFSAGMLLAGLGLGAVAERWDYAAAFGTAALVGALSAALLSVARARPPERGNADAGEAALGDCL